MMASSQSKPDLILRDWHPVGLMVRSGSYERRVQQDFGASLPPLDKPDA
jgi:hypothetical protein